MTAITIVYGFNLKRFRHNILDPMNSWKTEIAKQQTPVHKNTIPVVWCTARRPSHNVPSAAEKKHGWTYPRQHSSFVNRIFRKHASNIQNEVTLLREDFLSLCHDFRTPWLYRNWLRCWLLNILKGRRVNWDPKYKRKSRDTEPDVLGNLWCHDLSKTLTFTWSCPGDIFLLIFTFPSAFKAVKLNGVVQQLSRVWATRTKD